jgi:hypothetical protein
MGLFLLPCVTVWWGGGGEGCKEEAMHCKDKHIQSSRTLTPEKHFNNLYASFYTWILLAVRCVQGHV